jgi:hypothetical protein
VSCSGTSCSITLTNQDATVNVLGTTVTLGNVHDGQATVGIAGHDATCTEGQSLSAGPLKLVCSTITGDSVTLSASLAG